MTLWEWAGGVWSKPGVRPACLVLQDDYGQCVPLLLWGLWLSEQGAAPDDAMIGRAVALCRGRMTDTIKPLRAARRDAVSDERDRLLEHEVHAEKELLELLEVESLDVPPNQTGPKDILDRLGRAWGDLTDENLFDGLLAVLRDEAEVDEEASNDEDFRLREMLAHLRQDHRDLNAAIEALGLLPLPDQLQLARLKKRKLVVRDQIAKLENSLTPDLIA